VAAAVRVAVAALWVAVVVAEVVAAVAATTRDTFESEAAPAGPVPFPGRFLARHGMHPQCI
jgi:hypothetical protein